MGRRHGDPALAPRARHKKAHRFSGGKGRGRGSSPSGTHNDLSDDESGIIFDARFLQHLHQFVFGGRFRVTLLLVRDVAHHRTFTRPTHAERSISLLPAELRALLNDPIELAKFDRSRGDFQTALQDLYVIARFSPQDEEAQEPERRIRADIEARKPALTQRAEDHFREAVKASEKFPSTVDFKLFGTDSTVAPRSARSGSRLTTRRRTAPEPNYLENDVPSNVRR